VKVKAAKTLNFAMIPDSASIRSFRIETEKPLPVNGKGL
jgi:hypothetical protein